MHQVFFNYPANSNLTFFQEYASIITPALGAVISILVAWLTARHTINKYFQEQKTARLQKIYFDNSVIQLREHLENLFSLTNRNSILFSTLNQYVRNKAEIVIANTDKNTIDMVKFRNITSSGYIKEITSQIQIPNQNFLSTDLKKILNASKDASGNYFNDWLKKVVIDCTTITARLKNISANYVDYLTCEQDHIPLEIEALKHNISRMNNSWLIIQKHTLLLNIVIDLKTIMASKDYKNEKHLTKSLKKDENFLYISEKITEIFKILFCYWRSDNWYFSYAKNTENKHYKISFIQDNSRVEEALESDEKIPLNAEIVQLNIFQEIAIADFTHAPQSNLHEKLFEIATLKFKSNTLK